MSELDLYKMLTVLATYRAGGQVVVSAEEIDEIKKNVESLRIGVVEDNKVLVRIVPKM